VVVAVDQRLRARSLRPEPTNQVEYPSRRQNGLFYKLGGKVRILEMRGIDAFPDADRHQGFTETRQELPGHKVTSVFHRWGRSTRPRKRTKNLLARVSRSRRLDIGIASTSRCGQDRREAPRAGVGPRTHGFIGQLIRFEKQGSSAGAAVSNPPPHPPPPPSAQPD